MTSAMIARVWKDQVIFGNKTYSQVPRLLKEAVADLLIAENREDLVVESEDSATEASDVRLSYVIDKNGKVSDINIGYSVASNVAENAARNAILSIKAPRFPETENLKELQLNHYFIVKENKIYN